MVETTLSVAFVWTMAKVLSMMEKGKSLAVKSQ